MKSDTKIAVIGTVTDASGNTFFLSDGSHKVEVYCDTIAENGKLVRAFCSVIDGKLKADVIQNMEGLDLELFKKVEELYNKSGV